MEVNSKYAYAINFNTNDLTSISQIDALTQEENILSICKTVGLNEHDQLVLANYIAKMHAGLKVSDPNAIPILEVYRILDKALERGSVSVRLQAASKLTRSKVGRNLVQTISKLGTNIVT